MDAEFKERGRDYLAADIFLTAARFGGDAAINRLPKETLRRASALTPTEDSQRRRTVRSLLEWLGLSRFSSRLNIARICEGSSRTEGVR